MPIGVRDMGFNTATNLFQKIGMTSNHIDDRKHQITHRISDLIFLLNQLEKNNPFTYPNGTTHHFEYRLAHTNTLNIQMPSSSYKVKEVCPECGKKNCAVFSDGHNIVSLWIADTLTTQIKKIYLLPTQN